MNAPAAAPSVNVSPELAERIQAGQEAYYKAFERLHRVSRRMDAVDERGAKQPARNWKALAEAREAYAVACDESSAAWLAAYQYAGPDGDSIFRKASYIASVHWRRLGEGCRAAAQVEAS